MINKENKMLFSEYSDFYDLYYADKDYVAEVDFVLELAHRFGDAPKTLLDMGCGTGRHLEEFVKRGLKCDGFDISAKMLSQAKERLAGSGVSLQKGNLIDFENHKQYDLVIAMFAVMGYLSDNEQLLAGLRTAKKHLKSNGVFIFDGWFGPAVLAQKPEKRRHEYEDGQNTVVRKVVPSLDPIRQTVTVHYDVSVNHNGKIIKQIQENHGMRLIFIREMALLMQSAGLKLVHFCPFLEPDGKLSTDTWNATFVAQKVNKTTP